MPKANLIEVEPRGRRKGGTDLHPARSRKLDDAERKASLDDRARTGTMHVLAFDRREGVEQLRGTAGYVRSTSGGVGGERPRGRPLSRLKSLPASLPGGFCA